MCENRGCSVAAHSVLAFDWLASWHATGIRLKKAREGTVLEIEIAVAVRPIEFVFKRPKARPAVFKVSQDVSHDRTRARRGIDMAYLDNCFCDKRERLVCYQSQPLLEVSGRSQAATAVLKTADVDSSVSQSETTGASPESR